MHEHLAWDIKLVYRTYATYNSSDKIGLDIYFNFWKRALIWWNVFICNYACLAEIHAETTVEYVSALHSAHCTQSAYVCASGVPSMKTCDRSDHGICHAVHSSFQIKSSFEFCVVSGVSGTMHSNEWMPAYFLPHSVLCNQWSHIHCQLEHGSCWFCVASFHFILLIRLSILLSFHVLYLCNDDHWTTTISGTDETRLYFQVTNGYFLDENCKNQIIVGDNFAMHSVRSGTPNAWLNIRLSWIRLCKIFYYFIQFN